MTNARAPAFPMQDVIVNTINAKDGLTKREYFAGLALQGILANPKYCEPEFANALQNLGINIPGGLAVQIADALLAELAKDENNG